METLQKSIENQRQALHELLSEPLEHLARQCVAVWGDRQRLNVALASTLDTLTYCKHLYVMDASCRQISDNVSHAGLLEGFGRDRSRRPYVNGISSPVPLVLSQAYMSLKANRPSLTAVQDVRDESGRLLGYIGAYFGLRDLPLTRELYEEPRQWRQIKGDPSIRETVFYQQRTDSVMDQQLGTALGVVTELMLYHGVFHVMLHFSSSRAVIWLLNDPYRYRLLSVDMLVDPNMCLAYPRIPYPEDALIPMDQVRAILDRFMDLRRMDEMFYLRSGTVNIFNGIVGLTFSCDGSHYVPYEEFLNKGQDFWVGASSAAE
jgi:hypothetical protein